MARADPPRSHSLVVTFGYNNTIKRQLQSFQFSLRASDAQPVDGGLPSLRIPLLLNTTIRRVSGWWKRNAEWLALALSLISAVLAAVVLVQAAMLHTSGWRIALGTVPAYLGAMGTVATAISALFAVRTFRMASDKREIELQEQRDQLANQARLIIVEAVPRAEMVPPANEVPVRPDGKPEYRYVVIRNHSHEPIFNIRIPDGSNLETRQRMSWITSVAEVRAQHEQGSFSSPRATIIQRHPPELIPVLAPGQSTFQLHLDGVPRDEQVTEKVYFTFTDARGARWQRLGSDQPRPDL